MKTIPYSDFTLRGDQENYGSWENIKTLIDAVNAQFTLIDSSSNISITLEYLDGSIAVYDARIVTMDVSIGYHTVQITKHDASIGVLTVNVAILPKINASINDFTSKVGIHNASIGDLTTKTGVLNASIGDHITKLGKINASIGVLLAADTVSTITDTSAGVAIARLNKVEASINTLTFKNLAVDASLTRDDASIKQLFVFAFKHNASIGDLTTKTGVLNASIGDHTTKLDIINVSIGALVDADTLSVITNTSIGATIVRLDKTDASIKVLTIKNISTDASLALTMKLYTGAVVPGTKDASGVVGNYFFTDNSLFIRSSVGWFRFDASVMGLG